MQRKDVVRGVPQRLDERRRSCCSLVDCFGVGWALVVVIDVVCVVVALVAVVFVVIRAVVGALVVVPAVDVVELLRNNSVPHVIMAREARCPR